jgi:peptidyl-prolyl cis-trans isomerase-like protein 2
MVTRRDEYLGKNFEDEFEGPLKHARGAWWSMANKGKNTNSSQFFITYRGRVIWTEAYHLKVAGGLWMLKELEKFLLSQ